MSCACQSSRLHYPAAELGVVSPEGLVSLKVTLLDNTFGVFDSVHLPITASTNLWSSWDLGGFPSGCFPVRFEFLRTVGRAPG